VSSFFFGVISASFSIFNTRQARLPDRWLILPVFFVLLICSIGVTAQISLTPDNNTLIIEDAPEQEIFSYGKTVIVKQRVKGVLSFGGDVIVEGSVDGDIATVGGSVIQREKAYIGGDVIILGGRYKPECSEPLREAGKETVMYAGYEEELRNFTQNPSSFFAPSFSFAFLAQRVLSALFWFIVSLGLATLAPGAVSRAVARFQLSTLKIIAIGIVTFLVTSIGVIGSLSFLPNYLGAVVGLMAFVLLMLAYVFGRVALNVSVGKIIQKRLLSDRNQSESLAIFAGVVFWTLLLSIPYVWTATLLTLFAAGIGLVMTLRQTKKWRID
jgi:hypothetical protein